MSAFLNLTRREFLKLSGGIGAAAILPVDIIGATEGEVLPKAFGPTALPLPHFPDALHAVIWRNWTLVPLTRLAKTLGATQAELTELGTRMGLPAAPDISAEQQARSYITVIRRNWDLLPYDQLLQLLDWTPAQLAFTLREDDFLFVKLGNSKPTCEPVRYAAPGPAAKAQAERIGRTIGRDFPERPPGEDPLFGFIPRLSKAPKQIASRTRSRFSPRFCYSYFALYGDPLLDEGTDAYPDGYLAQLAAAGADGIWLQGVLHKLAPFPWDESVSARHEVRLKRLRSLVARAKAQGIGVYLYLNEPRAMPLSFFAPRAELKGVTEVEYATLCTSHPDVQKWLVSAVSTIVQHAPDLAGFFTITASENLSNCWSHQGGKGCARCGARPPAEVIAEVNGLVQRGIEQAGAGAQLIAWDWGWPDAWAHGIIQQLPATVALMSVSEWSLPIERGGVRTQVGEYSLSSIGPGPRAQRHWAWARERGLKTLAKIQAGNTWELSAVPYIPVLENVARHASNLLQQQVNGLMLGWTLGGYPSPNLEIVSEIAQATANQDDHRSPLETAMSRIATRRFGGAMSEPIVRAWSEFSAAFREFPFDGGVVYNAPMQYGPSNLLWARATGRHATMVGFPYDDLEGWRGPYPAKVFVSQFEKVADGFDRALRGVKESFERARNRLDADQRHACEEELRVGEACAIHFRTTANQARFVLARQRLESARSEGEASAALTSLEQVLEQEIVLARRLWTLQNADSRIGFEASNQYYYVPPDLMEKVLNCRDLLERWIPEERRRRREGAGR